MQFLHMKISSNKSIAFYRDYTFSTRMPNSTLAHARFDTTLLKSFSLNYHGSLEFFIILVSINWVFLFLSLTISLSLFLLRSIQKKEVFENVKSVPHVLIKYFMAIMTHDSTIFKLRGIFIK